MCFKKYLILNVPPVSAFIVVFDFTIYRFILIIPNYAIMKMLPLFKSIWFIICC